jgi:hypothetical protein
MGTDAAFRATRLSVITLAGLVALATGGCLGSGGDSSNSGADDEPRISSLSPATIPAGGPDLAVTVNGTNFDVEGHLRTWVVWSFGGEYRLLFPRDASPTRITVTVPAELTREPVTAEIFVQDYDSMSDADFHMKNPVPFVVSQPESAWSMSPTSAVAGSGNVTLTVHGAEFDFEGVIQTRVAWTAGGQQTILHRAPGVEGSATELAVTIPARLLVSPLSAEVAVESYDRIEGSALARTAVGTFVVTAAAVASLEFAPVDPMSLPRNDHTATLLEDGSVLIVGGAAGAELFDPAASAFARTNGPPGNGIGSAAVRLADGRVLVVGGAGVEADIYDPATGTFAPAGRLHASHVAPTATALADGRVLIAGGVEGSKSRALESAEVFDPATGAFTEVAPMESARTSQTAALLPTGEVLLVGGRNGWAPDSADDPPWDPLFAELFDPAAGLFTRTDSMQTTRVRGQAVVLADGSVLVLGGFGDWLQNIHEQPQDPPYAERFDPGTRNFSAVPTPRAADTSFTATLLPDGNVLLIGGNEAGRAVDTVRLLDPGTGQLRDIAHLTTPRARHTATLLTGGRVLVTGGVDADGNALASAEISTSVLAD